MRTSARIPHYWKHRSVSTLGDIRAHYGASLASSYVQIAVLAIRRIISVKDFGCLKLILLTPLMYTIGFRGMVETGIGRMRSQNRQELRAIMYSTFKTHFCYLRRLAKLSNGNGTFSVVVDVGANAGDFTIGVSDRSGKVIAIEPGQANFSRLQSNIKENHLNNVRVEKCAAHDRDEQVVLEGMNSDLRVTSGFGETADGIRLDVLLSKHEIDEVDLIKIDVQGHEEHVISGLRNTLENGRIKLAIVELHPKRGVSRIAVIKRMKSLGYRPVLEDKYLFGQTQLYFDLKPQGHSGLEDSNPISFDAQGLPDPTLESRLNLGVPTQL